jgi:hypothetical protein
MACLNPLGQIFVYPRCWPTTSCWRCSSACAPSSAFRRKLDTAFPMGIATTFVMLVASLCAFGLNLLLTTFQLEFLRLISYIVVIASAVQLVEMFLKKYQPGAVPRAGNLPAADHHQLRGAGRRAVPDGARVQLRAGHGVQLRRRRRLHPGAGADGQRARAAARCRTCRAWRRARRCR